MKMIPIEHIPLLHLTPLASTQIGDGKVILEVDDENEKRMRITFGTYQAVKQIIEDCFILSNEIENEAIILKTIVEIENSSWIKELEENLSPRTDGENFLNKSHHYLVPLQEDFLEVVAWDIKYEYI